MSVTIKDISESLGLSPATVSMALNNRKGVNSATRQKVLEYVQQVGYAVPDSQKPVFSDGSLQFIVYRKYGRVLADTQFFSELIEGVEYSARKHRHSIALSYCNGLLQVEETLKVLKNQCPAGLLILATEMDSNDIRPFLDTKIPMVLLDCDLPDCGLDTVLINNADGIRQAVKHLADKGHRELGYAHSSFAIQNFFQRARGFQDALAELGLQYNPRYMYLVEPSTEVAFEDMRELLKNGAKPPAALICDNDIIACGVAKALKQQGYRIPEDVSLVGFDNVGLCRYMEPELTSVNVPKKTLGGIAVKQLLRRIRKPDEPTVKILVSTELVERNSVF